MTPEPKVSPPGASAQPSAKAALDGSTAASGVKASFKVGDRVMFRGVEHEIFANGDRPGTFDICQPGWPKGTDRWMNVPPDQLTAAGVTGTARDLPPKCKDCGAKITDGAAKCPRGGGRTCWVGQRPAAGVKGLDISGVDGKDSK